MDRAFNGIDRLWISQSNFVGRQQLEFLQKWSTSLKPPLDTESGEAPTEESVKEGPTTSEQVPKGTWTEDSVKKYVESLGDEFFGVPKTVTRKNRRRKRNSQEDGQDEDAGKETVPEEVEGACGATIAEDEIKEDSQLCGAWRNPKDDQLEDEEGQAINEFNDDDDEWSSCDEKSLHETDDDDEDGDADDDLSSEEEDINTDDKNNLCEGLKAYMSGELPTRLPEGFCSWKNSDSIIEEGPVTKISSDSDSSHDSDISIVYEDLLASGDEDNAVTTDHDSNAEATDEDSNTVSTEEDRLDVPSTEEDSVDEVSTDDEDSIHPVSENEDSIHPVSANEEGHSSDDSNGQFEVVPANANKNNDDGVQIAIADTPSSSDEHNNNAQLLTTTASDAGMGDEYWNNLQRKLWEDKKEIDPKKKAQLQKMLSMDDEELDFCRSQTEFSFNEIRRVPFVDKPVVKDGLMPILAPPIPKSALAASQALSVYANFARDPGAFQWRCKSVNEQVANSLDDDLYWRKTSEAKEKWIIPKYRDDFVSEDDVIFIVVLYHRSTTNRDATIKLKEPQMAVTVNVLGSQTLNDLRSKFYCKNDHIGREIKGNPLANEASLVSPDACLKAMEKNMDKPCGIFVGDTMYINKASEAKKDNYGEALNQWYEVHVPTHGRKAVGSFKIGSMEKMKMVDLVFKPGFPYLFVHQGNCEHLMVIENVRTMLPQLYLLKAPFPKIAKSNFRTLYCQVDNTRIARYVIRKASWFPQDPTLLCPECLALCFKNDERVENFKIYHFHQIASLF